MGAARGGACLDVVQLPHYQSAVDTVKSVSIGRRLTTPVLPA